MRKKAKKRGLKPKWTSVSVVTTDGDVKLDGLLKSLNSNTLEFLNGPTHQLSDEDLVVTRISKNAVTDLSPNTPVLLSKGWGCGGAFIYRGFFVRRKGDALLFQSEPEAAEEELDLLEYDRGIFRILWPN